MSVVWIGHRETRVCMLEYTAFKVSEFCGFCMNIAVCYAYKFSYGGNGTFKYLSYSVLGI